MAEKRSRRGFFVLVFCLIGAANAETCPRCQGFDECVKAAHNPQMVTTSDDPAAFCFKKTVDGGRLIEVGLETDEVMLQLNAAVKCEPQSCFQSPSREFSSKGIDQVILPGVIYFSF